MNVLSRKKSSRRLSTEDMLATSPLNPSFHTSIVDGQSSKSPFQAWRLYRQKEKPHKVPETVPEVGDPELPESFAPTPPSIPVFVDPDIPTPDYDSMSVASSNASSYQGGIRQGARRYLHFPESSTEELRNPGPHFFGYHQPPGPISATGTPPLRCTSQFSIPRYAIKHRTRSLLSASPRLEHMSSRSPSTDSILGTRSPNFSSTESQIWYQNYQNDSFPHNAIFGDENYQGKPVDGRINHIKGNTSFPKFVKVKVCEKQL